MRKQKSKDLVSKLNKLIHKKSKEEKFLTFSLDKFFVIVVL